MLRLRQLREEMGVSQASIAALLNLTQQAVAKWESGKAQPDIGAIVALTKYFGVTTDYLLGVSDTVRPVASSEGFVEKLPRVERDTLAAVRRYKSDPYFPELVALYGEASDRDKALVRQVLSAYQEKNSPALPVDASESVG